METNSGCPIRDQGGDRDVPLNPRPHSSVRRDTSAASRLRLGGRVGLGPAWVPARGRVQVDLTAIDEAFLWQPRRREALLQE